MKLRLFVVLIAVSAIAGCKGSTSPINDLPVGPMVVPSPGSWFTYSVTQRDSTGHYTLQDSSTYTILDTGLTLFGKTGVVRIVYYEPRANTVDTSYRHYESNGDITMYTFPPFYRHASFLPGWVLYPYGSQQTLHFQYIDMPLDEIDTIKEVIVGAGNGSFNYHGTNIPTRTIRATSNSLSGHQSGWVTDTNITTFQYAPSLGMLAVQDEPSFRESHIGSMIPSYHVELIDYYIKK